MGTKTTGLQWVTPKEPHGSGIFPTVVDLSLWIAVYVTAAMFPEQKFDAPFRAICETDRFLSQWNYETIRRAIVHARKRKLLVPAHRGRSALPQITEEGKRRLASIVPVYDQKRVWDGRMHLVTYDVPEKQKEDRAYLRDVLRTIGAGKLQQSVWITPYNPIDMLRECIAAHHLQGTVIISDMGTNAAIGEEDIKSLVVRVWQLDELNDRYKEWLAEAKRSGKIDHWMLVAFLTILKEDPQLPFPLLPPWWQGDRAYHLIRSLLQPVQI